MSGASTSGRRRTWFAGRVRTSRAKPAPSATNLHVDGVAIVRAEQQRPEREPRRKHRVARRLVVQRRVGRVHEQERGGEEGRDSTEGQRRGAPGDDRRRVEDREDDLEEHDSTDIEREPDDEGRDRGAEDLERLERRPRVEELEVVGEVVPGVPPLRHRPAARLDPVDAEREDEHDRGGGGRRSVNARSRDQARVTIAVPLAATARSRDSVLRSSSPILASMSSTRPPKARPRSDSCSAPDSAANVGSGLVDVGAGEARQGLDTS